MNKKFILIVYMFLAGILFSPFNKVNAFPANSEQIYNGIDVSEWQGDIDFSEVKASGIEIVYIKSSEGNNYIDPYFKSNYEKAVENNLSIGFYHYLTAADENEALEQARFFASVINGLNADCRLAMDFEVFNDLSLSEINNISLTFLSEVENITKKEVVVYSDAYNARATFSSRVSSKYPIWVAEYGSSEPENGQWSTWIGFQYTDEGRVSGIYDFVDKDYFTKEIFLSDNNSINVNNSSIPSVNTDYIIVEYGNTLSQIALEYNTSYQYLAKINNIVNPNLIFVGEKIYVPTLNNGRLSDTSHILYIVKRGNTLTQISKDFNISINSIVRLNNIKNPNLIFTGEVLRLNIIN